MIYWAPLFHFYQPPIQIYDVLRRVCDESYIPLLEVFRQFPYAKATVNINGVLTESLFEHGFSEVIDGLKELAQRGQVEFTGSGKYHPILPLIPREEMVRQIRQNYDTNRHFLGETYNPRGFFPPELAYSKEIVGPVVETRHDWLLLAGVACPAPWPLDIIYQLSADHGGPMVFFRDDILSNKISFQSIDGKGFIQHLKALAAGKKGDIYVITAMDAETFGHHIENWEELFLAEVYERIGEGYYCELHQEQLLAEQTREILSFRSEHPEEAIQTVTIGELLSLFPRGPVVEPRASSWSSSDEDLRTGNPYPLWKDPKNQLHQLQWEHLQLALDLNAEAARLADNEISRRYAQIARGLLEPALHSCQFWWGSKRPMWDINMINRGLLQQEEVLLNALKAIQTSSASAEVKRQSYYKFVISHDLRTKIRDKLFME